MSAVETTPLKAIVETTHKPGCPCGPCARRREKVSAEYIDAWQKMCKVAKYHATIKAEFMTLFTEEEAMRFRSAHDIGQPRLYAPDHVFTEEQTRYFIQNGAGTPGGGSSPKTPKQSDNGKAKGH